MSSSGLPRTAKERGVIAPSKLAHCVLRTRPESYAEMVTWWRTVLEAKAAYENPFVTFMTYDEEHHRLAITAVPGLGERAEQVVGVDHIAFTYASLSDLIHTYERLEKLGITPVLPMHHGPTLSLYYLDPDKNQVELQIDVFEDLAEQAAFIASDHFGANPLGVVFDPADLAKRFHEGVPENELKKPLPGPPDLSVFPRH